MRRIKKLLAKTAFALITASLVTFNINPINYADAADFSKLVILHTNDTHGYDRYDADKKVNGLALLAQLKKDLIAQGYQVILLDAGDCSQDNNLVNMNKGKAAFEFFNAVGYSAGCLGNHEFDYGQNILNRNLAVAKYPIVSSNIIVEETGHTLVPASTILQVGDVKLGVIGFTTPETVTSTSAKNTKGLTFLQKQQLYAAAREQVAKMKAAGCDIIIGLGHMGSSEYAIGNRSDDIILNVDGFDLFVDGHDHMEKNRMVNNTLLVETGYYNHNFGMVKNVGGKWQETLIPFGQLNIEDPAVKKLIDEEQARVDQVFGMLIAKSDVFLDGRRTPGVRTMETNLGDLVADAYFWQSNRLLADEGVHVDGAILNGGSIRQSIKAGDIHLSDVSAVLPFNNGMNAIKITGAKLLEIIEASTCILPDTLPGLPQVAGIKYTVDTTVPFAKGKQYSNSVYCAPAEPGSRVTIEEVGGEPFNVNAEYVIVLTDFLLTGGDSYGGLTEEGAILAKWPLGCTDMETLQSYITDGLKGVIGVQYKEPQGRVTIIK